MRAVAEMGVGLPEPACRSGFQTTQCGCVQKAWSWATVEKASLRRQVNIEKMNESEPSDDALLDLKRC